MKLKKHIIIVAALLETVGIAAQGTLTDSKRGNLDSNMSIKSPL